MEASKKGREVITFLKSFEGAAATFHQETETWTLWLPEMVAGDRPVTPASQLYFAVILRHEQQAFAIRFFYDCSTGKIRYYTSAVPEEIATAPKFENAVSELFRHTLPVEPIRQRKLRGAPPFRQKSGSTDADLKERRRSEALPARSLAEPIVDLPAPVSGKSDAESGSKPGEEIRPLEIAEVKIEPVKPRRAVLGLSKSAQSNPASERTMSVVSADQKVRSDTAPNPPSLAPVVARPLKQEIAPRRVDPPAPGSSTEAMEGTVPVRRVHVDVGERLRSVLITLVLICGVVAALGIIALAYAHVYQDPGITHHKLQLEALKIQRGDR